MLIEKNIKIINGAEINSAYLSQDMPGWSLKGHDSFLDKVVLKELLQQQNTYQEIRDGILKVETAMLQHIDEIFVEAGNALPFISADDENRLFLHLVIVERTEAGYNCLGGNIIKFCQAKKNNLNILVYEKKISDMQLISIM